MRTDGLQAFVLAWLLAVHGCGGGNRWADADGDGEADADSDVDVDVDVDADTDGDTDGDSDTDADGPPCGDGGVCQDDRRCQDGRCVPWGEGEYDPACVREAEPGPIRPQLQCSWDQPPDGDPTPTYTGVRHTPLVADIGVETAPDVPTRPAVVFISDGTYSEGPPRGCTAAGTLRVIDGATCRELAAATDEADRLNAPVTPAIGDLDGDPELLEVIAAAAGGGLIAFRWEPGTDRMVRVWKTHLADGTEDLHGWDWCQWGAVALADLDDDGRPEVVFEGAVWSSDGERLGSAPGWPHESTGFPSTVADVDLDGVAELVNGATTWHWDAAARTFTPEAYFTGAGFPGYVALADFGDFPAAAGDGPGRPEVVSVHRQQMVLLSIGGTELSRLEAPSTGGGPPTIADYDGDGAPEAGAAFGLNYVVWDVGTGTTLWQRPSQDISSARTGSSVFDFNGDGRAEVVYGDECYVRIYDGPTGEVIFSQARFSSTWQENPIVADVDGDFAAEVVMGMSGACHPDYCPPWDPLFPGLACDVAADCPGGPCVEGRCRCETDAECGATYGCTDPLEGTPGEGRVCRARHLDCVPGLRIYRDARDRWASSRRIWNQHAYSVTNVEEDGRIPRTSEVSPNWSTPGLNNFRQNVQGELTDVPGPDFTVGRLEAICEGEATRLRAEVCNRGGALIDSGVTVIFARADDDTELCRLVTEDPVPPGTCAVVECVAPVRASGEFVAFADPDHVISECLEDNNTASGEASCLL